MEAFHVVFDNRHLLLQGLAITVQLSVLVILLGSAVGFLLGLALTYGPWPVRLLIRIYVDVLRGLPLLVIIFVVYFGLPILLGADIDGFVAVTIALSAFVGANMSEIVRGAVTSIPRSQMEAAKSLGLTFWPRMRYVIFPQAVRRTLPPWMNLNVEVVKGTSLVSLVSVADFLLMTQRVIQRTQDPMPFYLTAGLVYFLLSFLLSRAATRLEHQGRLS